MPKYTRFDALADGHCIGWSERQEHIMLGMDFPGEVIVEGDYRDHFLDLNDGSVKERLELFKKNATFKTSAASKDILTLDLPPGTCVALIHDDGRVSQQGYTADKEPFQFRSSIPGDYKIRLTPPSPYRARDIIINVS